MKPLGYLDPNTGCLYTVDVAQHCRRSIRGGKSAQKWKALIDRDAEVEWLKSVSWSLPHNLTLSEVRANYRGLVEALRAHAKELRKGK